MQTQINKTIKNRYKESGNVLFLILIAVALFAALSYAVTQSSRSGGGDAAGETNLINSAQLTQYPAGIRTSIIRMIVNGADVNTLEFNTPADYANCTAGFGRCVFHPAGGGATSMMAPGNLMDGGTAGQWIFNGANEINLVGTTVGGDAPTAATADMIAFLPGITSVLCRRINDELGIGATIPVETNIVFTSASSMINPDNATPTSIAGGGGTIGDDVAALDGQPFGCFSQVAEGQNVYYHALIEQ